MGTETEGQSLEEQIAECCQVIRSTTEVDVATDAWERLRDLIAKKNAAEDKKFISETADHAVRNPRQPAVASPTAPAANVPHRAAEKAPADRPAPKNDVRRTPILSLSPYRNLST